MANDVKERPSVVQRILQHPATAKHEPEVEESRETYQEGRANSRENIMLDIRLADGSIESFNYAYLTRVRFQPGDRLTLHFGKTQIGIEGRRLHRLREALTEHRVRFIQEENESEEGIKTEDAPHIEQICFSESATDE